MGYVHGSSGQGRVLELTFLASEEGSECPHSLLKKPFQHLPTQNSVTVTWVRPLLAEEVPLRRLLLSLALEGLKAARTPSHFPGI